MELINSKFHSEALERREGDIIMRLPFKQTPQQDIYLFLLLEFQSTVDPWVALRFGTYVHLLYQQLLREGRLAPDGRLPPVFPLLLYNGDTQWKAATDLKSLISLPDKTPLWRYQPAMRYYLVDESRYPEGKAGSLSGLRFKLENIKDPKKIKAVLDEMTEIMPSHLDSLKRAVSVWVSYVLAPHKGIKLTPRDTENLDEVKNMLATRIEHWESDIREESLKEGREEGRVTLFLKMAELKYGALPDWAKEKMADANAELIERWAGQLLSAQTLKEVFE